MSPEYSILQRFTTFTDKDTDTGQKPGLIIPHDDGSGHEDNTNDKHNEIPLVSTLESTVDVKMELVDADCEQYVKEGPEIFTMAKYLLIFPRNSCVNLIKSD